MAKSTKIGKSRRPPGRNPVIAVRVSPPLHKEITQDAKASQRTMSQEMEDLLRAALEHRKRFRSGAARAIEAATLALLLGGERYAKDNNVVGHWDDDLESRRWAAIAACTTLITQFVSSHPRDQADTVEALKGRIWTTIANRPDVKMHWQEDNK